MSFISTSQQSEIIDILHHLIPKALIDEVYLADGDNFTNTEGSVKDETHATKDEFEKIDDGDNSTLKSSPTQNFTTKFNHISRILFEYLFNENQHDSENTHAQFFNSFVELLLSALKEDSDGDLPSLKHIFQFNSGHASAQASILAFVFSLMTRFDRKLPAHVIAALQILLISYMSLFYHFHQNTLSERHVFRFRMRLIDFTHVFVGHLIDEYERSGLQVPSEVQTSFQRTRWRPFGGVIPFCCRKEYASKFPILMSLKHGVVRLYLPRSPLEPRKSVSNNATRNEEEISPQSTSQESKYAQEYREHLTLLHNALTADQDQLENFFNELLSTQNVQQLHFPHKRIDCSQLLFEDQQGNIRVKPTLDLCGSTEELQLLLQRMLASEMSTSALSQSNIEDQLDPTDLKILRSISSTLREMDEAQCITESIVHTIYPTLRMLNTVQSLNHFRDSSSQLIPFESVLRETYKDVMRFLSTSITLIHDSERNSLSTTNRNINALNSEMAVQFALVFDDQLLGTHQMVTNPQHPKAGAILSGKSTRDVDQARDDLNALLPESFSEDMRTRIVEENLMRRQLWHKRKSAMRIGDAAQRIQQHMILTSPDDTLDNTLKDIEIEGGTIFSSPLTPETYSHNRNLEPANATHLLDSILDLCNASSSDHITLPPSNPGSVLKEDNYLQLRMLVTNWTNLAQYSDAPTYFNSTGDILGESKALTFPGMDSILRAMVIVKKSPASEQPHLLASFKKVIESQIRGTELERPFDMLHKGLEWDYYQSYFDGSPLFTRNIDKSVDVQTEEGFSHFIDKVVLDLGQTFELLGSYRKDVRDALDDSMRSEQQIANQIRHWTRSELERIVEALSKDENLLHLRPRQQSEPPRGFTRGVVSNATDMEQSKLIDSDMCTHFQLSEKELSHYWEMFSQEQILEWNSSESHRVRASVRHVLQAISDHGRFFSVNMPESRLFRLYLVSLLMSRYYSEAALDIIFHLLVHEQHKFSRHSTSFVECLQLILQFTTLNIASVLGMAQNFSAPPTLDAVSRNLTSSGRLTPAPHNFRQVTPKIFRILTLSLHHLEDSDRMLLFEDSFHCALIAVQHINIGSVAASSAQDLIKRLVSISAARITESSDALATIVHAILTASLYSPPHVSMTFAPLIHRYISDFPCHGRLLCLAYDVLEHLCRGCLAYSEVNDETLWQHRSFCLKESDFGSLKSTIEEDVTFPHYRFPLIPRLVTLIISKVASSASLDLFQRVRDSFQWFMYLDKLALSCKESWSTLVGQDSFYKNLSVSRQSTLRDTLHACESLLYEHMPYILTLTHLQSVEEIPAASILSRAWKLRNDVPSKECKPGIADSLLEVTWDACKREWKKVCTPHSDDVLWAYLFYSSLQESLTTRYHSGIHSLNETTEEMHTLNEEMQKLSLASIASQQVHFSEDVILQVRKWMIAAQLAASRDARFFCALDQFVCNPSLTALLQLVVEDLLLHRNVNTVLTSPEWLRGCHEKVEFVESIALLGPTSAEKNTQSNIQLLYGHTMQFTLQMQRLFFCTIYREWVEAIVSAHSPEQHATSQQVSINKAAKYHLFQAANDSSQESIPNSIRNFWNHLKIALPRVALALTELQKVIPSPNRNLILQKAQQDVSLVSQSKIPSQKRILSRISQLCDAFASLNPRAESTHSSTFSVLDEEGAFQSLMASYEHLEQLVAQLSSKSIPDLIKVHLAQQELWRQESDLKARIAGEKQVISLMHSLVADYVRFKRLSHVAALKRQFLPELHAVHQILSNASLTPLHRSFLESLTQIGVVNVSSSIQSLQHFFDLYTRLEGIPPLDTHACLLSVELTRYQENWKEVPFLNLIMEHLFADKRMTLNHFLKLWIVNKYRHDIELIQSIAGQHQSMMDATSMDAGSCVHHLHQNFPESQPSINELAVVTARWWPELHHALISTDWTLFNVIQQVNNPLQLGGSLGEVEHFARVFLNLFPLTELSPLRLPHTLISNLSAQIETLQLFQALGPRENLLDAIAALEILGENIELVDSVFPLLVQFSKNQLTEDMFESYQLSKRHAELLVLILGVQGVEEFSPSGRETVQNDSQDAVVLTERFAAEKENFTSLSTRPSISSENFRRRESTANRLICDALLTMIPNLRSLLNSHPDGTFSSLEDAVAIVKCLMDLRTTAKFCQVLDPLLFEKVYNQSPLFAAASRERLLSLRQKTSTSSRKRHQQKVVCCIQECLSGLEQVPLLTTDSSGMIVASTHVVSGAVIGKVLRSLILFESHPELQQMVFVQNASFEAFSFQHLLQEGMLDHLHEVLHDGRVWRANLLDFVEKLPATPKIFCFKPETASENIRQEMHTTQEQSLPAIPQSTFPASFAAYTLQLLLGKELHCVQKSGLQADLAPLMHFLYVCSFQTQHGTSIGIFAQLFSNFWEHLNFDGVLREKDHILHLLEKVLLKYSVLCANAPSLDDFCDLCGTFVQVWAITPTHQTSLVHMRTEIDLMDAIADLPENHLTPVRLGHILHMVASCTHISLRFALLRTLIGNCSIHDDDDLRDCVLLFLSKPQPEHIHLMSLLIPLLSAAPRTQESDVFEFSQVLELMDYGLIDSKQCKVIVQVVVRHFWTCVGSRESLVAVSPYFLSLASCLRVIDDGGELKQEFVRFLRAIKKDQAKKSFPIWSAIKESAASIRQ